MIQRISDLPAPGDPQGRTYRQINLAQAHEFNLGELVEYDNGARLFVVQQTRDCDGTPLYTLTHESAWIDDPEDLPQERYFIRGFNGRYLRRVQR